MKLQVTGQISFLRSIRLALTVLGAVFTFAAVAQANTFVVTNTDTFGPGSLGQAILDANTNPGADTITFNIPGSGVHTINLSASLPTITDPVTIDGYTQPGAGANTLALGSNAVLLIELNGVSANSDAGLKISAGNSTIRGLAINRFNYYGIFLQIKGGNVIAGNHIGTDASGTVTFPRPNNGSGIYMNSPSNTIGGLSPADRNLVAGNGNANGSAGIYVDTVNAQGNKIIGNYVGTNSSGTAGLGGMGNGIVLTGCSHTTIGGTTPAELNVITGGFYGITLYNASFNQITGNYLGPLADGAKYGSNFGLNFGGASKNNTVGGTTPSAANIIAWNKEGIILGKDSVNNAILGNSIHDNSPYPAIDLYNGAYAVTPNDDNTGDADTGANNLQNFPVITSVVSNGGVTTLGGTLDSAFNTVFRVEFFANKACHVSGFGEGQTYLGFTDVTTDAGGKGTFSFSVPTLNLPGLFFTATATDPGGNTSEFSACASGAASVGTLQLSTTYVLQSENDGNFNINVTRTNGSAGTVTVDYSTADGTAKAPFDYVTTSGTLVFNDGETSKSISVPIKDNSLPEGTHTLTISLSNPTGGAALGNIIKAQLSIQDNEYPTLSIDDVTQAEGNSGTTAFTFTITSSDAITNDVSVKYSTADGTATSASDYQTGSGTITIPAGQKTATATILVQGDTTAEADKTFLVNLSNPNDAVIGKAQGTGTILNDDGSVQASFEFSQANYNVNEDLGALIVTVIRSGDTSGAASVDYATVDGNATQKADFEYAAGTLTFAPGETSKTLTVLLNEDGYVEGSENFSVSLSNPGGAVLGQQSVTTIAVGDDVPETPPANQIDDATVFVYTHYHDFLNREPDPAGLAFWTNQIVSCGNDVGCIEAARVNVSASFFLSIEFQETGYLCYLLQKESFGTSPKYAEFMRDVQEIGRGVVVNAPGWQQKLKENQQQFAEKWVARPAFKAAYDQLSNADYVNALYAHAGVLPVPAERDSQINALDTASQDRAAILLEVAESAVFRQKENSAAFVLMQYFGYLRRDPDAAPDADLSGYNFWLNKLNQFGGNYVNAEMIKAFITSLEYRGRFGQ
jgi:hypothetical protein